MPIINHVLLISKLHVYNSKGKNRLNIMNLLNDIKKIKKTESRLYSIKQHGLLNLAVCVNSERKRKIHQNKWRQTHEKLPIEQNL